MNLTTIVEPPVEPVTVPEVYEFLRWDAEDEGSPIIYPLQNTITTNIRAARLFVEQATRRALVLQTIRLSTGGWHNLELRRPPFVDLVSVEYYNEAGTLTTLDNNDFYLTDDEPVRLRAMTRVVDSCHDLARYRDDSVRVIYRAGYPPVYDDSSPPEIVSYTANIPDDLKTALMIQVQLLSDRFDVNEKADLERTRDALLSSNRVHSF